MTTLQSHATIPLENYHNMEQMGDPAKTYEVLEARAEKRVRDVPIAMRAKARRRLINTYYGVVGL